MRDQERRMSMQVRRGRVMATRTQRMNDTASQRISRAMQSFIELEKEQEMNNVQFLRSIGVSKPEILQKCLLTMEKYGDNHWWEPDVDLRKFAYYQIKENLMLCSEFSYFHKAIELLLGRPVYTHEFGISIDKLRQEAERAYVSGGVTSEAERQERVAESIQDLQDWAKRRNIPVIGVQLPEE